MTKNEGRADRWLRIVLGVALVAYGLGPATGVWFALATLLGLVFVATGFFGYCPAYSLLGISTCSTD